MKEFRFFENSTVIVTQTRFIVEHKVVEIKNISSAMVEPVRNYRGLQIGLMISGIALAFFEKSRVAGLIIFSVAFIYLLVVRTKYSVRINTNSGTTHSLVSRDRQYIEQVVKAVNSAMWVYYLMIAAR
jgi:hypothetical protein